MADKKKMGAIALTCVVAASLVAYLLLSEETGAVCNRQAIGLEDNAPLELAAILNEDCMKHFMKENPDRIPAALVDFKYPTLLLDAEPQDDVFALFQAAIFSGERSFFENDLSIRERLSKMRQTAEISSMIDFVVASQTETAAGYVPNDMERFLTFLPVWKNAVGQTLFLDHCADYDCAGHITSCPVRLGLSDKAALVEGDRSLAETIALCPIAHDWENGQQWFTALRQAGVVDTTCSVTTQVNAALNDGRSIENACFSQENQIGDYSDNTSSDVVTFIKQKVQTDVPKTINAQSLEIIIRFSPEIAEYLMTLQGD
ncbi:hypothetical protein [Parasulfitobacter algicola]|uniref:Uncharacterized protein n=1 Tax=Parasulfitobacter algicola TaxID=2614809 RepID=A0ABX2J1R7_9RHOB|nr:hypothetical protein [Sulfitobacter algicola]NSX57008.1 hypothetical protein [Sulfitobacter algicola]